MVVQECRLVEERSSGAWCIEWGRILITGCSLIMEWGWLLMSKRWGGWLVMSGWLMMSSWLMMSKRWSGWLVMSIRWSGRRWSWSLIKGSRAWGGAGISTAVSSNWHRSSNWYWSWDWDWYWIWYWYVMRNWNSYMNLKNILFRFKTYLKEDANLRKQYLLDMERWLELWLVLAL